MTRPNSKEPRLTAATAAFVKNLEAAGGPPLYTLTPQQAREVLNQAQAGPVQLPEVVREDLELPVGPGGRTAVRIVRPVQGRAPLPFMLYLHGGGWIMGNKETHNRLVSELVAKSGRAAVFVDYTPSPEARYPVAIEQDYAVLKHLAETGEKYSLSPERPIVVGDSVGGNMALALALKAKGPGPRVQSLILFYPVTDAGLDTESYHDFAEGPWLTKKAMEWFWEAYLPDKAQRSEPGVSPFKASLEELEGLPPTLIITAENDVLRDEGEAMAFKLDQAGVPAASVRLNGTIHDFVMLNALAGTGPAQAAVKLAVAAVKAADRSKYK